MSGHGDYHTRVSLFNHQLKLYPDSIELLQARGELHLSHEKYRLAIKDLKEYQYLAGKSQRLSYSLAKAFYHLGSYEKCARYLQEITTVAYFDLKSYSLIAQYFTAIKDYENAVIYYQMIIDSAVFKRPEFYLDLAGIYEKANLVEEQIRVLNQAVRHLGYLPVIYTKLVEVYAKNGEYSQAIAWQNRIVEQNDRKEFALYRRAQLYKNQGDFTSYTNDLLLVMNYIEQLPPSARNKMSSRQLYQNSLEAFNRIKDNHE
jgi:tetratricopeptide (TPR) repeat protein